MAAVDDRVTEPDGPLALWTERIAAGELKPDPIQESAARRLEELFREVADWRPGGAPRGLLARFGLGRRAPVTAPTGLYLFGPVGRGKSMLMDLFYETVRVEPRRRAHFQEFMQETHTRIHRFRQDGAAGDAPILAAASAIAAEARLLCFDEFEVRDIADAMILARLFSALLDAGVIVVTTSNRHPDELYKGGLHRDRFLPFIDLLKQRLDVVDLGAGTDYRLDRLVGRQVYFTPVGPEATAALDRVFAELTGDSPAASEVLAVQGRELVVPIAAKGVARFGFEELCGAPRGPSDFLALARNFHAVMIEDIPRMTDAIRDKARRFMTLIDVLYERRCSVICSAAAEPDALYDGSDWGFEFARTVSRLQQMRSADYLATPHRPDEPRIVV